MCSLNILGACSKLLAINSKILKNPELARIACQNRLPGSLAGIACQDRLPGSLAGILFSSA